MDCWSCGSELIWGGDENGDEEDVYEPISYN
jgi:hypothetical protein